MVLTEIKLEVSVFISKDNSGPSLRVDVVSVDIEGGLIRFAVWAALIRGNTVGVSAQVEKSIGRRVGGRGVWFSARREKL